MPINEIIIFCFKPTKQAPFPNFFSLSDATFSHPHPLFTAVHMSSVHVLYRTTQPDKYRTKPAFIPPQRSILSAFTVSRRTPSITHHHVRASHPIHPPSIRKKRAGINNDTMKSELSCGVFFTMGRCSKFNQCFNMGPHKHLAERHKEKIRAME